MASKTPKIPKQYRVTFKVQIEHVVLNPDEPDHTKYQWDRIDGTRLGFANAYEPGTKAYLKRKETQDQWAYNNPWAEKEDGVVWMRGRHLVDNPENPKGRQIIATLNQPFPDHLQPIIIDNVPLEGFKVVKSVSRYSTSNKLWRILDPRGFELEISSQNLEDIILGGDIKNGLIDGKCIWTGPKTLERV